MKYASSSSSDESESFVSRTSRAEVPSYKNNNFKILFFFVSYREFFSIHLNCNKQHKYQAEFRNHCPTFLLKSRFSSHFQKTKNVYILFGSISHFYIIETLHIISNGINLILDSLYKKIFFDCNAFFFSFSQKLFHAPNFFCEDKHPD